MIAHACLANLLTIIGIDFYSFPHIFPQDWFGKLLVSKIFLAAFILGMLTMVGLKKQEIIL